MVESRWWNSTVAVNFRKQVANLAVFGSQLGEREWEFVASMAKLIRANDDFAEIGVQEWTPSAKQINYASALYRQYCTEALSR